MTNYKIFTNNSELYSSMLTDIENAKKFIFWKHLNTEMIIFEKNLKIY